jgi:hypothetical protein
MVIPASLSALFTASHAMSAKVSPTLLFSILVVPTPIIAALSILLTPS